MRLEELRTTIQYPDTPNALSLLSSFPRVIHEGQSVECVVEGCGTGEDTVHRFRVAAVNDVGMGPYSLPVAFTQRKACT